MNHDYAHCLEYKKGKCQKTKCFRAELVEDLKNYIGDGSMVTWASLKGTKYCEMEWKENRMDDLISRQAALYSYQKEVCNKVRCYECKATDEDGTCKLERWIKEFPSAERSGRWIPVTERLPEESGEYLVVLGSLIYFSWFYKDDGVWSFPNADITAWMQLPKPYKEGEEK